MHTNQLRQLPVHKNRSSADLAFFVVVSLQIQLGLYHMVHLYYFGVRGIMPLVHGFHVVVIIMVYSRF